MLEITVLTNEGSTTLLVASKHHLLFFLMLLADTTVKGFLVALLDVSSADTVVDKHILFPFLNILL